jgi:hypothetical protein
MNTILLLKENAEPTDSISFKLRPVTRQEGDATPGCTCDRWGHPCASRVEGKPQTRTTRPKIFVGEKVR